jgi:hypothetical protein
MSSEQRYDSSYEQLVQHDLPDLDLFSLPPLDLFDLPNLDLSGDSSLEPMTETYSHNPQEYSPGNSQDVGMSFSNAPDTSEQNRQSMMTDYMADGFELDTFGTPQPSASSAFTPPDGATTSKPGAENLRSPGDEVWTFDNSPCSSTAQPAFGAMHGDAPINPAVLNHAVTQGACGMRVPQTDPISVSFFFTPTLTRRTVSPRRKYTKCSKRSQQQMVWVAEMSLARL